MAPEFRVAELKKINTLDKTARKAAVMALFYPDKDSNTKLLLILRKTYKGVHSNQIGLPGGKEEVEDDTLLVTALRETEEEVGVLMNDITVVCPLTEIYIPPSNFLVQPYLGLYPKPKPFLMQESEVEALVEVFLTDFMDDTAVFYKKLTTSYASAIEVPAFKLNGYTVWGATAMMLNEIKELLKQVL